MGGFQAYFEEVSSTQNDKDLHERYIKRKSEESFRHVLKSPKEKEAEEKEKWHIRNLSVASYVADEKSVSDLVWSGEKGNGSVRKISSNAGQLTPNTGQLAPNKRQAKAPSGPVRRAVAGE